MLKLLYKIEEEVHMDNEDMIRKTLKKPEFNLKEKLGAIDRQVEIPPPPQNIESLITSNNLMESINSLNREKAKMKREEIERDEAKVQYLKNISENMDYIVKQFKDTAISLERLNNMLERMGLTFEDIRKDVEESKAVNFEIFEILGKENIANEKGRLEATETLLKKFKDPVNSIDVSANIMSILDIIINLIN